jgi:hypothetical protein
MDCKMSAPLVGMMVGCILASLSAPAKAVVLFVNPLSPTQDAWCDPCSISQPSPLGTAGGRVWDSFTLNADSTLQSLRWFGLRSDALTLGVDVEIANAPYTSPIFFQHYDLSAITRVVTNTNSERRTVSLPDIVLSAGTYWLTIYGPSILEKHTWFGAVEPTGDNSLLQYFGPDPDHPNGFNPRFEDARFQIDGIVNPVPLPAALPLYGTGLGVLAFLAWRRKRKAVTPRTN